MADLHRKHNSYTFLCVCVLLQTSARSHQNTLGTGVQSQRCTRTAFFSGLTLWTHAAERNRQNGAAVTRRLAFLKSQFV